MPNTQNGGYEQGLLIGGMEAKLDSIAETQNLILKKLEKQDERQDKMEIAHAKAGSNAGLLSGTIVSVAIALSQAYLGIPRA